MMVSVQDAGRRGHLRSGISRSGPMDPWAFQVAQALVGNPEGLAALEFAFVGGTYQVSEPVRFAVTGGAVDIRINGQAVPAWESHHLQPGDTLAVGHLTRSVWGYIAFSGGIDTPPVLGSRATHLRTHLGGLEGRTLKAGDTLPLGDSFYAPCYRLSRPVTLRQGAIRITPGPQIDYFSNDMWGALLKNEFRTSTQSDRMAYVLDGPPLVAWRGHDIISDGLMRGSIQVPGSGKLLVLASDCQTTGGYPKIASVISVDLPRLLQMPPGRAFKFSCTRIDDAEDELVSMRRRVREACETLSVKK